MFGDDRCHGSVLIAMQRNEGCLTLEQILRVKYRQLFTMLAFPFACAGLTRSSPVICTYQFVWPHQTDLTCAGSSFPPSSLSLCFALAKASFVCAQAAKSPIAGPVDITISQDFTRLLTYSLTILHKLGVVHIYL